MKQTPLFSVHQQAGAKIVSFAGFYMPLEYSGIKEEHMTVRKAVGLFDVSHMGEFWVSGPHALSFLQKITVNDVSAMTTGKIQYTCFPNGLGGIVDDLLIYKFDEEKYLLVVNASNIQKDWVFLNDNNSEGADLKNVSDETAQIAVQGPRALDTLQKLTTVALSEMKAYNFCRGTVAGMDEVIISRTGYTGEIGFELYLPNDNAILMWHALMEAGKEYNIKPIGLGARDTLRLEAGMCLYGNDIDETTSPIEAGLEWIVCFKSNKDFLDKEFMKAQRYYGVKRKLIAFEMIDRGIPRHNYAIVDNKNNAIGKVTSGTISPILDKGIGMGYVQTKYAQNDSEIFISIRDKMLKAKIVTLPFVEKKKY